MEGKKRRVRIVSAVGDRLDKSQDFGRVGGERREEKENEAGEGVL